MRRKKVTRRFDATEPTIYRDLRATIIKLQATSLRVDYDLLGGDPNVRVYFDRSGKRYVSECRQWPHFLDNLRAAQLAIEYTYRIGEAYGVNYTEVKHQDLFDRIFAALEAPLDPNMLLLGSGSEWWEVLGVSRTANRAEIVNAYQALAKIHHPDVGSDADEFVTSGCELRMRLPFGKPRILLKKREITKPSSAWEENLCSACEGVWLTPPFHPPAEDKVGHT